MINIGIFMIWTLMIGFLGGKICNVSQKRDKAHCGLQFCVQMGQLHAEIKLHTFKIFINTTYIINDVMVI